MVDGYQALTEKEKETLRLLLAGHDAKSIARHVDLSVHTINERLREARRKLSVSSSREAARLLRQCEDGTPEILGDRLSGAAAAAARAQSPRTPTAAAPRGAGARGVIGGLAMLSILAAAVVLFAPGDASSPPPAAQVAAESDATQAARDFLLLGDAGKWEDSYAATARSFRALNTLAAWQAASQKARVPLGAVLSRTLIDEQDIPAPPSGLRTVRFRTDFANRRGATETLSLDREGDAWKVVGVYIG